MNKFETYIYYSALRLHFTTKYDYFKYKGRINRTPASFEKLKEHEKILFQNISEMREPKTYITGNFILNPSKYIRDFNKEYYLEYRKLLTNGEYTFRQDLLNLSPPFTSNFPSGKTEQVPVILQKYISEDISLYTACVFESMMNWTQKIENLWVEDQIKLIRKSCGFFKFDINRYKQIVLERFKKPA